MISKELLITETNGIGITLTAEMADKFDLYAKLLTEYNKKVNLTAITEPEDIVIKHFVDSLYLLKFADVGSGTKLCDVGTGAGFPGAALLIVRPEAEITLFDSINKKLDFIRYLLKELDLDANVVTVRAEEAGKDKKYREKFDVVTARAVAQLNILSEYCIPLVKKDGVFAPLKAVLSPEEEQRGFGAIANLGAKVTAKHIYTLSDNISREIIIAKKISQTDAKYPRNAAQISKKPL